MAGERVMWLVWHPGDAAICFKSEVSGLNAWSRLYTVLDVTIPEAKSTGWRCSRIVVEDEGE